MCRRQKWLYWSCNRHCCHWTVLTHLFISVVVTMTMRSFSIVANIQPLVTFRTVPSTLHYNCNTCLFRYELLTKIASLQTDLSVATCSQKQLSTFCMIYVYWSFLYEHSNCIAKFGYRHNTSSVDCCPSVRQCILTKRLKLRSRSFHGKVTRCLKVLLVNFNQIISDDLEQFLGGLCLNFHLSTPEG